MSLNDRILAATGGPTVNGGLASYYGKTPTETLNDAAYRWLRAQGVAPAKLNDMWYEFLRGQGYTGSFNDMVYKYWLDNGAPDYPPTNMTELVAAGSKHYTIPSVTIAAAGSIEVESVTTSSGVAYSYLNGYGVDSSGNFAVPAGCSDIKVNGISVGTTGVAPNDGKLNHIEFVITSGSGALTHIAQDGASGGYLNGIIREVKITDNGTLIRHYKIDETWTGDLILKDSSGNGQDGTAVNITSADSDEYRWINSDGVWLGSELVVNGDFTDTSSVDSSVEPIAGWDNIGIHNATNKVTISDGEAHFISSGTWTAFAGVSLIAGIKYRSVFDVVNRVTPYRVDDSLEDIWAAGEIIANGTYYRDFTAVGTQLRFARVGASDCGLDNVSVKRLIE